MTRYIAGILTGLLLMGVLAYAQGVNPYDPYNNAPDWLQRQRAYDFYQKQQEWLDRQNGYQPRPYNPC